MQIKTAVAQNPNLMGSLMLCAEFLKIIHILLSLLKFKTLIIKIPKDSLFIYLVLNAVSITVYRVKAVQDDISARTFPI